MPPYTPPEQMKMTPAQVREWWSNIELDRKERQKHSPTWKQLRKRYLPPSVDGDVTDVNSNVHFRNTALKMADLWGQRPELKLSPSEALQNREDPSNPGQPMNAFNVVAIKKEILNKQLGPDYADVDLTIDQVAFDLCAISGVAGTKICYEPDVQMMPMEAPGPAVPNVGDVLGLSPIAGPPVMTEQPVVVHERWRWFHFSPEKLIIPHDWHSTDYDDAPYLGMEFSEKLTDQTRKAYNLPADFKGTISFDKHTLSADADRSQGGSSDMFEGVEIWLHANQYDPAVANSQVFYRLVLVEGLNDRPAIYTRSPYQDIGPDGKLTPDSLLGNVIHPFTVRVCTDEAWIKADAEFTDPLVRLKNIRMMQDVKLREANMPRFFVAMSVVQALEKLNRADVGQGVALPDDKMVNIGNLIKELPHLEHALADVQGQQEEDRALTETLGIGPNQAGGETDTTRSATETATVQSNINKRMRKEQKKLVACYMKGVRKFDTLLQRYMDQQDYIEIVGENGLRTLLPYTQAHVAVRCAYDYVPDSQLAQDPDARIKRIVDFINFLAKSPFINQKYLVTLATNEFGYDPSKALQEPPPPPPPTPDPLKGSLALKAIDMIIPEVRAYLAQCGVQLEAIPSPELMAAKMAEDEANEKQPHGGGMPTADTVSKHKAQETGRQDGVPPQGGVPAPRQMPGVM